VEDLRQRGLDGFVAERGERVTRPLGKRAATGVLRGLTRLLWGDPPFLIEEIVDHLGAGAALKWFMKNLPTYESSMKLWGPLRTHLLCIEASLLNGCSYCIHAHAYAFQLHYFKQTGSLFPLDEHAVVALRDKTDTELKTSLNAAIQASAVPEEATLFEQLWAQKFSTAAAADDTERRIRHLLSMFEMLNFCGIERQVPFDHAHDPINKDRELKRRYAEARLAR
jgi:hypothetical protein